MHKNCIVDLKGTICGTQQTCEGKSESIIGNTCCLGTCKDKESGSNRKLIGWMLVIAIVILLVFFYLKYNSTKKRKIDFSKPGGLKR